MLRNHIILCLMFLFYGFGFAQVVATENKKDQDYLSEIKDELKKKWPNNKTINIVFHGHSVPSGYFKTPVVNTLSAYPYQVLREIKEAYPYAVVNAIVTAVGGENSVKGGKRFENEVLNHKPDVLCIDYGLNDRKIGLEQAKQAWEYMIKNALKNNIRVILLTPSPDTRVDYKNTKNALWQHANQIRQLAQTYKVELVDSYKAFEFLYAKKKKLETYMAQVNHPNEKGHELITNEIMKHFK